MALPFCYEKSQTVAKMLSARNWEVALEISLFLCAVAVISHLCFPARPFPGLLQRWSLRPVLLLVLAVQWLKLLSDFQLKLIYGAFIPI